MNHIFYPLHVLVAKEKVAQSSYCADIVLYVTIATDWGIEYTFHCFLFFIVVFVVVGCLKVLEISFLVLQQGYNHQHHAIWMKSDTAGCITVVDLIC